MQKFLITTTKQGYLLTRNNHKLHYFGTLKMAVQYAKQVQKNYTASNLIVCL